MSVPRNARDSRGAGSAVTSRELTSSLRMLALMRKASQWMPETTTRGRRLTRPPKSLEVVEDLDALEDLDWRSSGPYDISEVDSIESAEESPRIDLGSLILLGPLRQSELRLQVAEETGEIVSGDAADRDHR